MSQPVSDFVTNTGHFIGPEESEKLQQLQSRIDDLLSGTATPPEGKSAPDDSRVFAQFVPRDQQRASALAALCMKLADEQGGVKGLESAVDLLFDRLGDRPVGMVQYALKLFLTHYKPAREHLDIRSLEKRQPDLVRPSL